ncbi:MAG: response regulator transcription factor [Anaerolineae bacterium]|nr:response regulator transcription factor [Anaerolineae bacterium]
MDEIARRVLIVTAKDDLQPYQDRLTAHRFEVMLAGSSAEARRRINNQGLPHLLVVDLDLPEGDGLYLCHSLHDLAGLPIIGVSTDTSPVTALRALEHADDFVRRPLDPDELLARTRRILSRINDFTYASGPVINVTEWMVLDPVQRRIIVKGHVQKLTPIENALLHVLLKHRGEVVDADTLIERVWQTDPTDSDRNVLRVHVHRLRQKIERNARIPNIITTERGVGYSFSSAI